MEIQERVKQYLEGGKTRAEAINLAYSDHYGEVQKMQQGGIQEKPVDTGQYKTTKGKSVVYGTPEYREAYNKGEVLSSTGERSPIALDEVIVENNYKKDKNWLEQYADKIVEENKDAGVLGAIFGTPISAVTSLPQMFATKAITGEMQRPSEAMDIENPYGAMAVDAIADPANLIGAGLLTKENALARIAASKESGLLSNAYKLNPLANKEAYNTLYHNTNNLNFSLEDVDLLRRGSSQMKAKYANRDPNLNPSGFYTTDNPNSVFMGGNNTYSMQMPKNAKIADLKAAGRTTDRISKQELLDLQKEGYDIIRGKNMLGLDEYIPLNKSKISNWENLGERVKDPSKTLQRDIYQYEQPNWLTGFKQMQQGGGISQFKKKPFQLQNEVNQVQKDNTPNTKRDLSLMMSEYNNINKDQKELRTTGQIKTPSSIQYSKNIKPQAEVRQDNISTEQRNAQLNPLEKPLIYLANPSKVLGDLGVLGMETSELDRQAIVANRFNPNQTRFQRLENQAKLGLGYVPEATINTAMAAAFMPEGSGALGLVNEALNPLAGIKTSIPDSMKQGLNSQGFLDIFKRNEKTPIASSLDNIDRGFNSEINWTNWNKEIPENKALLQEYNNIEKQAKANGSWMKNPDGSEFQGTPEQFVQQNSESFKKAFPEGYKTVFRGMSSDNPLLLEKQNFTGVFTGDKNLAKGYGKNLYELGLKNSKNSISFNANGDDWLDLKFSNRDIAQQQKNIDFNKKYLEKLIEKNENPNQIAFTKNNIEKSENSINENIIASKNENYKDLVNHFKGKDEIATDDIATYLENKKLDNIQINNILDGEFGDINISNQVSGNYLKSLLGNNGMFDMTNPNIYKSAIPIAGASYLATQEQTQFQQGGEIKYTKNELDFLKEFAQIK